MKKIKTIIAIITLLVMATSCEKNLDLKPHQNLDESVALTSDVNVKIVMVGAYAILRSSAIYGGCILRNSELSGADGEISWQGTYNGPREIYNHQLIAANGDITNQWLSSYECVNICNNVLSALDVVNADDRGRIEGEALFLRSLMFFDLVRFYAKNYEPGTANSQFGIPLVLTPTSGIGSENLVGRNTVEEVYTKVITDLERAATILPDYDPSSDPYYYATSGAANALLARVYLQKGDYAHARDAANKVIGSGLYQLRPNYAQAFNNEEYSIGLNEDIFSTKFVAADGINQMTEFWSTREFGGRDGDIEIMQKHLDLYDSEDQRLALFWIDGNETMRSGKWNTMYGLVNLFRLSEMYLTRAECNQRLGTTVGDTPVNDYNMTHERAGLIGKSAVTLNDILLERRLELAHEGFKLHDMKRLKQSVGTLPYNDPKLVYPIPAREIAANPTLKGQQNEGY